MIRTALFALTLAVGLPSLAVPVQAQDFLGQKLHVCALQMEMGGCARQGIDAFGNPLRGADVLRDPKMQAAYRAGACGPHWDLQTFAYLWAATEGCTPAGLKAWGDKIEAQKRAYGTQPERGWSYPTNSTGWVGAKSGATPTIPAR